MRHYFHILGTLPRRVNLVKQSILVISHAYALCAHLAHYSAVFDGILKQRGLFKVQPLMCRLACQLASAAAFLSSTLSTRKQVYLRKNIE